MKKFWLLVCTLLLGGTLAACGQKNYAGVQLDSGKYEQLMKSNNNIDTLLKRLNTFNYQKNNSANQVYEAVDAVMNDNAKGLTTAEKERLDIQLDNSPHGIKGIIQSAVKNKYAVDPSVASQFHDKFVVIIDATAKAVTYSDTQAQKVSTQIAKELHVEKRLDSLGMQH